MYTLDTIGKEVIAYTTSTEYINIKYTDTVLNIVIALSKIGRDTFSVQDIAYIVNRYANVERHTMSEDQVKGVLTAIARENKRSEFRYGMKGRSIVKMSKDGFFWSFGK